MAGLAVLGMTACQKDNTGNGSENNNGNGQEQVNPSPNPGDKTPLAPEKQKENLIATAEALLDALDLDHWKADADWAIQAIQDISDINGKADDELDKWADAMEEAMYKYEKGDNWELTKVTVDLAKITGHFTENNGVFHREDANNLSIDINLAGEPVHAEFNANGYYDPMLFYVSERVYESYDYYGNEDGYQTYSNELWVAVPKVAELKITRSGKEFAVLKAEFSVKDVDGDKTMNPGKDEIGVKVSLAAAGYELAVNKLDYTPSNGAVEISFKKGNQRLLALSATAAYQFNEDLDFQPKSADVAIDLMGMTQVKGSMASYDKLMEAYDAVNKALKSGDEAAIDAAFANFEKCYDLGVYYDGGSLKQATVGFDYVVSEDGHNHVAVLIRFADGSTMAAEEFFSEENFSGLMNKAKAWLNKISEHFSNVD